MKTKTTQFQKKGSIVSRLLMVFILASLSFNSLQAQTTKGTAINNEQQGRIIKGVISNEEGPLESASVILKGTSIGTTTDKNGAFTFPQPLKTDDVLLISYLGFETQEFKIKANSDSIRLQLSEDLVEFVGALNTDTPYKSKRSKD